MLCYADDSILTSLSVTGLQELIDTANSYITEHGLKFNPILKQFVQHLDAEILKTPLNGILITRFREKKQQSPI